MSHLPLSSLITPQTYRIDTRSTMDGTRVRKESAERRSTPREAQIRLEEVESHGHRLHIGQIDEGIGHLSRVGRQARRHLDTGDTLCLHLHPSLTVAVVGQSGRAAGCRQRSLGGCKENSERSPGKFQEKGEGHGTVHLGDEKTDR